MVGKNEQIHQDTPDLYIRPGRNRLVELRQPFSVCAVLQIRRLCRQRGVQRLSRRSVQSLFAYDALAFIERRELEREGDWL